MWRSSIALITIICIFSCSCAPYTIQLIERQEMMDNPDYRIAAVITKSGEYLEFDPDAVLKDSLIVGYVSDGPSISVALANVDSIYVKKKPPADADSIKESHLDEGSKLVILRRRECCILGGLVGVPVTVFFIWAMITWVRMGWR